MLSVSGRSNYSTANSKVAKHCNIRYLKDYNISNAAGEQGNQSNPYITIKEAQTSPMGDEREQAMIRHFASEKRFDPHSMK